MTEEELAAIEARVQGATPEPWVVAGDSEHSEAKVVIPWDGTYGGMIYAIGPRGLCDVTFIAAARTDIPALLAEVRRLRALVADQDPDGLTYDLEEPADV